MRSPPGQIAAPTRGRTAKQERSRALGSRLAFHLRNACSRHAGQFRTFAAAPSTNERRTACHKILPNKGTASIPAFESSDFKKDRLSPQPTELTERRAATR